MNTYMDLLKDDIILRQEGDPRFLKRYCIQTLEGYYCSKDFQNMQIGWYINSSEENNLSHNNIFYANKDISIEEELTVDYNSLIPFIRDAAARVQR